jgi:hypothetical protein
LSGSRLASAAAGLGRDDELRYSPMRCQGTCSYRAELNKYAFTNFETGNPPEGWESEGQFSSSNFEILIKQWSSSCPSGNFALACHSEEGNDEESRSYWVWLRFFAEFILSLSKGSEWQMGVSGWTLAPEFWILDSDFWLLDSLISVYCFKKYLD